MGTGIVDSSMISAGRPLAAHHPNQGPDVSPLPGSSDAAQLVGTLGHLGDADLPKPGDTGAQRDIQGGGPSFRKRVRPEDEPDHRADGGTVAVGIVAELNGDRDGPFKGLFR